ncbi:MAG TPA: hypothetical protein PJ998_06650 [Terrimesophilobacter sp.]|nr:hypothetical protein [Terrimesophilobacter sp.]
MNMESLLACVSQALAGEVGNWTDDGGELTGAAGFATEHGINLASYWKAGFFSALEPIGLAIDQHQLDDGTEVLRVVAVIPPAGSPLGKGKQGLIKIATMPGATWVPFETMGAARLQVDFVNPI